MAYQPREKRLTSSALIPDCVHRHFDSFDGFFLYVSPPLSSSVIVGLHCFQLMEPRSQMVVSFWPWGHHWVSVPLFLRKQKQSNSDTTVRTQRYIHLRRSKSTVIVFWFFWFFFECLVSAAPGLLGSSSILLAFRL